MRLRLTFHPQCSILGIEGISTCTFTLSVHLCCVWLNFYPTRKTITEAKVVPKTTERYKLFEGVYQVSLTADFDESTGKLKLRPVVSWSHPPQGTTKCHYIAATG